MEGIFSSEVIWFLVGLVVLLGELLTLGMVLVFFGFGALVTALFCLFFSIGINTQLAIFLLSSLLSLALLRKIVKEKYINFKQDATGNLEDDYIGQTVVALQDFNADTLGKVSFRDSQWDAIAQEPITKGQKLKITGIKSIRLLVEPLKNDKL